MSYTISATNYGYTIKAEIQPFIFTGPGRRGPGVLLFDDPQNEFIIDRVAWKYRYVDVGIGNNWHWSPPAFKSILVSIDSGGTIFLKDEEKSGKFPGPKKVVGGLHFLIKNPNLANNKQLEVEIYLEGSNPPNLKGKAEKAPNEKAPNSCDCSLEMLLVSGCQNSGHI